MTTRPPAKAGPTVPAAGPGAPASPIHPGWTDHGCPICLGYGEHMPGDALRQCSCCHGWGGWWKHEATGTLAAYPGGPLMGSEPVTTPAVSA